MICNNVDKTAERLKKKRDKQLRKHLFTLLLTLPGPQAMHAS